MISFSMSLLRLENDAQFNFTTQKQPINLANRFAYLWVKVFRLNQQFNSIVGCDSQF